MIDLTPSQTAAYQAIQRFLANRSDTPWDRWACTLRGYAGTGKTFTLTRLLKNLMASGHRVAMTAPTHQAVKVMQTMMNKACMADVDCMTIQSLLSLKVKRINGETKLVKASNNNHLEKYDVVIVDECSMVGDDLYEQIEQAAKDANTKILFTGDPAQIPPVNSQGDSPTFLSSGPMLTEVMRQAMDNPILAYCTAIRQAIERGESFPPLPVNQHNPIVGQGITVMTGGAFTHFLHDAFVASDYAQNPMRFRVIAYRNTQIASYNRQVQMLRYPMIGTAPFADGEPVYISEPLKTSMLVASEGDTSDEIHENTETLAMVDGSPSRATHPLYPHLNAWLITITTPDNVYESWTLDHEGWQQHQQALNTLASQIKISTALKKKSALKHDDPNFEWHHYYQLKDAFVPLRPAYAMTAHKSQGNTFENVFVDAQDIMLNRNRKEAMQILYVACSRATRNLIINIGHGY